MNLANQILNGDRLALARAISQIENNIQAGQDVLDQLFKYSGNAHLIGITGPSGAGKSTLVNALVKRLLFQNNKKPIGVIAIDPTSPFTGGAFLGDRIRMRDISSNPNVFVRSMATRGALGGLTSTTVAVAVILDAAGYDPVIIETVGTGQAEVDIARLAHTTIVVEAPGLGDDVQFIKAGILEAADIIVVNKADRPGVNELIESLKSMFKIGYSKNIDDENEEPLSSLWIPSVFPTVALDGKGIKEVITAIQDHKQNIQLNGEWQKRDRYRLQNWIERLFQKSLTSRLENAGSQDSYQQVITAVTQRKITPHQAVEKLLKG